MKQLNKEGNMFGEVIDFLVDAKKSYKEFDKLLQFYKFKDNITHKQHFHEVCQEIALFFEQMFGTTGMKITTYDIEKSFEMELYSYGNKIEVVESPNIISYDFSKSYALNGRMFFFIEDKKRLDELKENSKFLNFMFYEMKNILINYLAIQKIKDNSFVDEITSLPNRRFLTNHLQTVLGVAKKENLQIALLKIDVDHFKAILEEFNYNIGNEVLKKVAKVLQNNISSTDIITKFEGNTFLVCMENIQKKQEIEEFATQCIEEFAKEYVVVNQQTSQKLYKTICIGIVIYPEDGENFDELFRNCDIALDEAKNKGRSTYEFYANEQNCVIDLF